MKCLYTVAHTTGFPLCSFHCCCFHAASTVSSTMPLPLQLLPRGFHCCFPYTFHWRFPVQLLKIIPDKALLDDISEALMASIIAIATVSVIAGKNRYSFESLSQDMVLPPLLLMDSEKPSVIDLLLLPLVNWRNRITNIVQTLQDQEQTYLCHYWRLSEIRFCRQNPWTALRSSLWHSQQWWDSDGVINSIYC